MTEVTGAETDDLRPLDESSNLLLVGGGQASWMAAKALRRDGFAGRITLIGDERHPPYERPPLSKAILLGEAAADSCYLAEPEEMAALGVVRIFDRAIAIDRGTPAVRTAGGGRFPYDRLLLATGGRPRPLPPGETAGPGILLLRTLDDAEAIATRFLPGKHALIIGGGWIGLEVAASARRAGLAVTLVEASARLCSRALPAEPAAFIAELHRRQGVTLRLGRTLASLDIPDDRPGGVRARLDDDSFVDADFVIAGIGMAPDIALASDAGLATDMGILVDEDGRTSDPAIFAAGDVTETQTPAGRIRQESWANANEQAEAAAAAMLGLARPLRPPPWFWSDQFDINIQILGQLDGDASAVTGDPAAGDGCWFSFTGGVLTGVAAFNRPRDIQVIRRVLQRGIAVDPNFLAAAGDDLALLLRPRTDAQGD